MKRFIRCLSLVLVFVMCFATTVNAAGTGNQRSSSYFGRVNAELEEVSSTQFNICFDVTALRVMDELGASTIKVQRSSDDENWTTVKTYYKSTYTNMTEENRVTYGSSLSYTYTSGYYYRAYVTFYAKEGNNTAEYFDYSESVYF